MEYLICEFTREITPAAKMISDFHKLICGVLQFPLWRPTLCCYLLPISWTVLGIVTDLFPAIISSFGCRLGRLQDSNAVLSHFNEYSENCYAEVSGDLTKTTRVLKSMKSDLDYIFQKLRLVHHIWFHRFHLNCWEYTLLFSSYYNDCVTVLLQFSFQWLLICRLQVF